jgi:NAD(P)H-quinone oxidoreductase subunit 4
MLQMLSHGLIAAALFFLTGTTYDRTHTLMMDEMGGMAKTMPKTFAMFTTGAMASLALPGMSGFIGELTIFLGIATSDVYGQTFKVGIIFLTAVGLILTPIYLLSMLRQVFYGESNPGLKMPSFQVDAQPREIFIATCLLLPIIGIGLYPKLATNSYDLKTMEVAAKTRSALPVIVQEQVLNNHNFISSLLSQAKLAETRPLAAPPIL